MRKTFLSLFVLTAALCAGAAEPRSEISTADARATVKQGEIAGYSENGIYIYKGIPYAKAERFMPPKGADAWEGVRSCRNYGPTCPQDKRQGWQNDEIAFAFNWDDGYPGEDCLRANVWTPARTADGKKRPVMLWLHGGGFAAGSGQELPGYDGANLARKGDMVVVTINHRLNVLGFLDLSDFGEEYASSGNAGLLDLVAALEWVRDNAEAFGGDPSNVTIFGQSGGGGKVSTLCATPAAKGLFHKAIVQSGSILSTMTAEQSRRIGREVVRQLGLENDVKKLSTIPYEQLLAAGNVAVATVRKQLEAEGGVGGAFIFGWAPTVDGSVLPRQPFADGAPVQSRGISGLSMGGFGSLYYGLKYPDKFSGIYACSPALAVEGAGSIFDMVWTPGNTPFVIEIGTEDFLYESATWFNGAMQNSPMLPNYTYIERPGAHDWAFWTACAPKIVKFFDEIFSR